MDKFFAAAICAVLATPVYAHDHAKPDFDSWYQSLDRPDMKRSGFGYTGGGGFSCCNKMDCHETDAEIRKDEWWARLVYNNNGVEEKRDWIKVPPEKVITNKDNPTGSAVLCHTMSWKPPVNGRQEVDVEHVTIYCFIPSFQT